MNSTNSFRTLYKQLPQKTREVLAFENFDAFIKEIKETSQLSEVQMYALTHLTVQVIVGAEKNENFSTKIKELLSIEQDVADILSSEVSSKIIKNIDNLHQRVQQLTGEGDEGLVDESLVEEIRESKTYIEINDFTEIFKGNKLSKKTEGLTTLLKMSSQRAQKLLASPEWLKRIKELGLKYSLQETQIIQLTLETLLIIGELLPREDFEKNLQSQMGISQILAQQLAEEATERIFDWFKQEQQFDTKKTENNTTPDHTNTLDVPPPNLPSEEIIEEPLTEPKEVVFAPVVTPAHSILQEQATASTAPLYKETQPQTYSFKASPKVETDPQPTAPQIPKPASFIETKLTQPVKPNNPPFIPPQSYVSDPYREPLE